MVPVVTNHADIGVAAAINGLGIACHFERDGVGALLVPSAADRNRRLIHAPGRIHWTR